ncbi:MAG: CpXC domain-containing protein [Elusimicrobia bacterium]|nr:CpXC domain-containing protein [Candidatus Liberimonas magnetica]
MSLSKLEEVKCPCGEVFEAELWNSIEVAKDPDLKEQLLGGEINIVCCPECHQIFYAEHFILYLDTQNEIIAFVYPLSFSKRRDYWKSKMEKDFEKVMDQFVPEDRLDYKPELLFGLDSLVNLIHENDQASDEAAVLFYSAESLGLSLIELRPCLARLNGMPRTIPLLKSKNDDIRSEALQGLARLLKHNDRLTCYKKFYDQIQSDPNWALKKELIKPKKKNK